MPLDQPQKMTSFSSLGRVARYNTIQGAQMGHTYTKKIIHSCESEFNLSCYLFLYISNSDHPIPGTLQGKGKQV